MKTILPTLKQRSVNLDDVNFQRVTKLAHEGSTSVSGVIRTLIAAAWDAKQAKRASEASELQA
jgi:macrodomain Ter protein organizer (MatP/YcbG family)